MGMVVRWAGAHALKLSGADVNSFNAGIIAEVRVQWDLPLEPPRVLSIVPDVAREHTDCAGSKDRCKRIAGERHKVDTGTHADI